MHKMLLTATVCTLFISCSLNKQFISSVDEYTTVILPEYKAYINRDSSLNADTKRIRIQSADKFQELLNDAKKSGGH